MRVTLGQEVRTGYDVAVPEDALNAHILLTGISGSGKTHRLYRLEDSLLKQGARVLVLDLGKTHQEDNRLRQNETMRVSVYQQGIPFSVIDLAKWQGQICGNKKAAVAALTEFLDAIGRLGMKKRAALRRAAQYALDLEDRYANDLEVIKDGLRIQDNPAAEEIMEDFWLLWEQGNFHRSSMTLIGGNLLILDFSDYDRKTQKALVEMTLTAIWQWFRTSDLGVQRQPLFIVMDEFQNLNLSVESVTAQILREGRKFQLNLLLATQTLTSFDKEKLALLQQAGTTLFFKPAARESRILARIIYGEAHQKGEETLKKLRQGECIVKGWLDIGGKAADRVLILRRL